MQIGSIDALQASKVLLAFGLLSLLVLEAHQALLLKSSHVLKFCTRWSEAV